MAITLYNRALRHPNIVTFLGVCDDVSGLYLVTEWVARGDLSHTLMQQQNIPWSTRIRWARDASAAFAYLHEYGIIHRYTFNLDVNIFLPLASRIIRIADRFLQFRDVKTENLLLTDNERIKVCDLGFARAVLSVKKKRMSIAGTALYMAPEVNLGEKYDGKCDVFG